jgi:hypothetical protein
LTDLKDMGIQDVDARYSKANRYRDREEQEPVMVQLATPKVIRELQAQDRDSLGLTPQDTPRLGTPLNTPRIRPGTPLGLNMPYQRVGTPRRRK